MYVCVWGGGDAPRPRVAAASGFDPEVAKRPEHATDEEDRRRPAWSSGKPTASGSVCCHWTECRDEDASSGSRLQNSDCKALS